MQASLSALAVLAWIYWSLNYDYHYDLLLPTAVCAISFWHHYVLLLHTNFWYWVIWQHLSTLWIPIYSWIANKLFSSKTSFQNSFWDSVVKYPYYISSPLLTSMYVTRSMSLYNLYSFWHNNILWGRVVNHTSNHQPEGKGIFIRAYSPGESWLQA